MGMFSIEVNMLIEVRTLIEVYIHLDCGIHTPHGCYDCAVLEMSMTSQAL